MKRGRIFFLLAFILLIGLVLVGAIWYRFLRTPATPAQQAAQPTAVVDVVNVLVVTQRVPRGTIVEGKSLGMVPIPRQMFIEGMFTNISEVEGRMAKFDLEPGIPLTNGMLATTAQELSGTGSNAALAIPRGMVAVAIPIDKLTSTSYPPQPGDHVNVIATLRFVDVDQDFQSELPNHVEPVLAPGASGGQNAVENFLTGQIPGGGVGVVGKTESIPGLGITVYTIPSEPQRPRLVSQNLLQDAVVLKVGNFSSIVQNGDNPSKTPVAAEGAQASNEPTPTPSVVQTTQPDFVSLIVTPQDAITLNYLLYSGANVTLALRAADDDTRVKTEAVTLQFLLSQYSIPVPVKLPYSLDPRNDGYQPSIETPMPTPAP